MGLVLVDPYHPDYDERLLAALPAQSATEETRITECRQEVMDRLNSTEANPDDPGKWDRKQSFDQVRSIKDLDDLPLTVITAGQNKNDPCYYRIADLEQELWQTGHQDYVNLTSKGKQIIAEHSAQAVFWFEPGLIVDAILEMVEGLRE